MNFNRGLKSQGSGSQKQKPAQARLYYFVFDNTEKEEYADMTVDTV
jgi:hypothetical protein